MAEPFGSGISWPPPGLPKDARVFQLRANSKAAGSDKAHWRARPVDQALVVVTESFSYGLALDDPENQRCDLMLADLDNIDSEQARAAFDALPPTWMQQTASGKPHKIYETPHDPAFFNTYHNRTPWRLSDGTRVGDLKIHGYAVGPGSTVNGKHYARLNDLEPAPAPPELLGQLAVAPEPVPDGETIPHIEVGVRDTFAASLAGFVRKRWGLDEKAMARLLDASRSIMEQPIGNEWLTSDARRVAKSIANKPPGDLGIGRLVPEAVLCARDTKLIGEPTRWWVPNFILRDVLNLIYGDGECGKSTFGSWLFKEVTLRGGRALYIGVEESWERFGLRAILGGGNRDLMYHLDRELAARISFPKYAEDLAMAVALLNIDFVFFDSIMTHVDPNDRGSSPERDRRLLGSIAALPATSFGIFHERRGDGSWSGSAERRNVPRVLLHAQRDTDTDEPMDLLVEKSNFRRPKVVATFVGREVLAVDPETGQQQFEEDETGKLVPAKVVIVERGEDKPIGKKGKGKSAKVKDVLNLKDIEIDPLL